MNKESTRYKSNQQEKRIARSLGGRQVIGSGSTPFLKGDVIAGKLFIEAKTRVNPSKSIKVNKERTMQLLYPLEMVRIIT